jgi:hypothetical protein
MATLLGTGAILLWATLASLTALRGPIPPFQTTAIVFLIGSVLIALVAILRGRAKLLEPTWGSFALGVYGLFIYHALYFAALTLAPPAEASLITSLWALLTVLFSAFAQLPPARAARHRRSDRLCRRRYLPCTRSSAPIRPTPARASASRWSPAPRVVELFCRLAAACRVPSEAVAAPLATALFAAPAAGPSSNGPPCRPGLLGRPRLLPASAPSACLSVDIGMKQAACLCSRPSYAALIL